VTEGKSDFMPSQLPERRLLFRALSGRRSGASKLPPHPKRKHSSGRRDQRRAHDALTAPQLVACADCGARIPACTLCPQCGCDNGRKGFEPKKAEKKKRRLVVLKSRASGIFIFTQPSGGDDGRSRMRGLSTVRNIIASRSTDKNNRHRAVRQEGDQARCEAQGRP
jgi:large subunit ribosomal protein L32